MRHKKGFNHLGRKKGHRRAMLANMANSLITHKRIVTTMAKAKALRLYVEPLITKSKEDSTHNRRTVFSYLQDKQTVAELFREVGAKVAQRPGGYTRVIKLAPRLGDSADMAMVELVDYNELLVKEDKPKRSRRSRRGGKKKSADTASAAPAKEKEETAEAEKKEEAKPAEPEAPKAEAEAKPEDESKKTEAPKAEAPKDESSKDDDDKKDA